MNTFLTSFYLLATKIDAGSVGVPTPSANSVLDGVLNIVYIVAGIIAVIALIIGGLQYILSDGDSNRIAGAKNTILYAVVGLVIVMSAFAITGFVTGRIG